VEKRQKNPGEGGSSKPVSSLDLHVQKEKGGYDGVSLAVFEGFEL